MARRTSSGTAPRPGSARSAALALLARRDYTTAELREKLLGRSHSPDDVSTAISELTSSGALDDRRVAAAHARTSSAVKGRGRFRVAQELQRRGVPRAIVDEVLEGLPAEGEADAIRRILARKRWPARPSLADRRRMYQHLLRRGFPADAIRRALGRGAWEQDDPSDE